MFARLVYVLADAGALADWAGCFDPAVEGELGKPMKCEGSSALDAGVLTDQGFSNFFSESTLLSEPLVAGKAYTYSYDQILPFYVGEGISVDVYGAMADSPCVAQTKLFTLKHDENWHQSFCFTPDRAYERTIARVLVSGIWLTFDLATVGTMCKGCSETP
jgi:hypothetical protein